MNITTLAPPAAEPVGLAEAKAHLRIGFDGEDDLVAGLVAGARARIESATGIALIQRTLKVQLDAWPRGWWRRAYSVCRCGLRPRWAA